MDKTVEIAGLIDVHVHFRDPGMPMAETTASGLMAAKRGGFVGVVTMPNTTPAGDSVEWVRMNLAAGQGDKSLPSIMPSACITRGRLGGEVADVERLAEAGAAFFTDDGGYVVDDRIMEAAMKRIAALGMTVCQHALEPNGGVIRDCELARRIGLPIVPTSAETNAIRRDLSICRVTGCHLHIQHISTAEGVDLVRGAQREGLPVTAEATPHHLLLACEEITLDNANYKMAPPLGNREDRAELRKAVKEGVLMFATDHAPHPSETKSRGFRASANGIVGLETAVPITYAVMVEEEGMDFDAWVRAWHDMPLSIVSPKAAEAVAGRKTQLKIGEERRVNVMDFASRSHNCPYDGMKFSAWPV